MLLQITIVLGFYMAYRLYEHLFSPPNVDPHGKYVLISECDTDFGQSPAIELANRGFYVLAGVYNGDNK